MHLHISILLLFTGTSAFSAASGENVCNTELIERLVKRVETLESRDLQSQHRFGEMEKKLQQQGQEILTLRMIIDKRDKVEATEERTDQQHTKEMSEVSIGMVEQNDKKQADVPRIRRQEVDMNVAFLAILVGDVHHLGKNQNIAFEHVVTNEGSAYNLHDGMFVAPVDGVYVFSTTVTAVERNRSHYGFALNGNVMTTLWVDGQEKWYDSSSQTIVLKLQKGDDVSVKHTDSDKSITGRNHSLFSGFLLRQSFGSTSVVG